MSGNNWHFMNVQQDSDPATCMSFKGAQWKISALSDVSPDDVEEQEIFVTSSHNDKEKFDEAKREEIAKWIELEAFEEVPFTGQTCISTRWVLTKKLKNNQMVYKARLVARGFEEDTSTLQTDSPTCSKETLRLALCILASNSWKLHSLDVKSAFLQGQPINRDVFLKPPAQANARGVWHLLKCIYGLADAGRHWFLRVLEELIALGAKQCKFDGALFMWYDADVLCGIVIIHVDDMLFGGTEKFHTTVINTLYSTFKVGSTSDTCFTYIGLEVNQSDTKIELSMKKYIDNMSEMVLTSSGSDKKAKLSQESVRYLKQVSGQINWAVTQCRPDLAYENCYIGNCTKSSCVGDIHVANKVIRQLKSRNVSLSFHCGTDFSTCYLVSFCDASFGSLPNGGSQGAFLTVLVDKFGIYAPISWQSRRIRRVVKSTIAAECLAAIEAAESTYLLAKTLEDIFGNKSVIQTIICSDNRGLCDSVYATTSVEDKRLFIDICVLRDMIQNEEINDFRWVSTDFQVSNALTKQGASAFSLVQLLNNKMKFNLSNLMFE